MAKKEFSIPDCPQLSKYDGMGSAGASMMYHDRVSREGHRPGDYSETIEITTTHYHDNPPGPIENEMQRYKEGYLSGYCEAIKDLKRVSKISEIDVDRLTDSKGGYLRYEILASTSWKKSTFKRFGLIE